MGNGPEETRSTEFIHFRSVGFFCAFCALSRLLFRLSRGILCCRAPAAIQPDPIAVSTSQYK